MEIKKGYKQTEVGVIPVDWEIKELYQVAKFINGKAHEMFIDENGNYKVVNSKFVSSGGSVYKFSSKSLCNLNVGDITMVMSDIPNGKALAKCFLIDQNNTYTLNQRICALTPFEDSPNYLFRALNRNKYFLAFDSGTGQTNLRRQEVISCPVILPSKSEQTAIANALSDADTYINSIEKLIEKKRQIKQGAMQELLKPKDGWEEKPLKNVCWFQEGPGLRNWQFTTSGIKVINVTNLENGLINLDKTDRHISLEEFHKMYKHFEIQENDIVVASSGNSYGKVSVVRKQDLPLLMNTSVIRFKPSKELDYNFLLTFLKSNQFKNQIDLLITGGAQPNFGPYHLNKISINLPQSKQEQIRIATILYSMDTEIAKLEIKLEKFKKIKSGMMQNLLTGKIRLI